VRALAGRAKLAVADKPESQDLCFLAGIEAPSLLRRRGVAGTPGDIVDMNGEKLGMHGGHHLFTIGQRRGLGVTSTEPLYVIDKDPSANRITVGPKDALTTRTVHLSPLELHRSAGHVTHVKLRYRSDPIACRVAGAELELEDGFDGATPGQTAVLLSNGAVVGWGTIADPSRTVPTLLPLAASAHV
jgi:tRNA-specific 2-thiouridylase